MNAQHQFSDQERELIYRLIALRPDTRHFAPGARVEEAVLKRIVLARPPSAIGRPDGVRDQPPPAFSYSMTWQA